MEELIKQFKNREIKAKELFNIKLIDKNIAYEFIKQYHYLKDAKFFSKYSYGLFIGEELVGVSTFSNPQGNVALKGWFNLDNTDQSVLELSRLCLLPILNGSNATSYLLSGSIKELKKIGVRAVITLADDSRHVGSIYQVCNFKYYGLTEKKSDFYSVNQKLNERGETKNKQGVWINRTRKHRYAYIMDRKLICNYEEQERPSLGETNVYDCCGGSKVVYDNRFGVTYTCPKCCGELKILSKTEISNNKTEQRCSCGGRLVKTKYGMTCEDCMTDY
jgi:hypothetical protein